MVPILMLVVNMAGTVPNSPTACWHLYYENISVPLLAFNSKHY